MSREDFLNILYFFSKERNQTKSRIFNIFGFAITIVPAAQFIAHTYKVEVLVLTVPLLVVVVSLMYLGEINALKHWNRAIRDEIEIQRQNTTPQMRSWESGLEYSEDVVPFLSYSFLLLFFVYYLASVFFVSISINKYGIIPEAILLGFYTAIGVWFLIFLCHNLLSSPRKDKR